MRSAVNLLGSPGLEKQLEELVQNFIVEDKVRNAQRFGSDTISRSPRTTQEFASPFSNIENLEFANKSPGVSTPNSPREKLEPLEETSLYLKQIEDDLMNALKSGV
jgi:hypothetical protein